MIMARRNSSSDMRVAHDAIPDAEITDIAFCAWVAQAKPGDLLIYHRGFLVVDCDKQISSLPADARAALRLLGEAAMRAAEKNLVHLVQIRLGHDRFAYAAIARAKPDKRPQSLASLLLDAQAA